MRFVIFTHSLVSDWNHGNAHFLRGFASELIRRGHDVDILEPANGWSRTNLVANHGEEAIAGFHQAYPLLRETTYDEATLDLDAALDNADVVLVHEWNSGELIRRIGEHHARTDSYLLYFHDTHHRAVTSPGAMAAYDLRHYDAVLAYGGVLCDLYRRNGWAREAIAWHEAADTNVFRPIHGEEKEGDLVWIGNWGDDERTAELREFLIEPVRKLGLKARVYGVRYPAAALDELREGGIEYGGWLPNYKVPEVFARFRVTVHIPRRPYAEALPGIPTIRPFEALACGIPLISAPWRDSEGLFRAGFDFLTASNRRDMVASLEAVMTNEALRRSLIVNGLQTIRARHTCAHRTNELLDIVAAAGAATEAPRAAMAEPVKGR
ncbi:MAG TPA: glycosyltransferase [Bryobacteraceae bacterium]|jgi:spore maturation protein CgeB|nr:glycosyltransferase [Bryobacteraceae bacterium]